MSARSVPTFATARLAAFVVLALTAGGCSTHRPFDEEVVLRTQNLRDTLHGNTYQLDEPLELQTKGTLSVDVENFGGDVLVRANPKLKTTVIEVRRVSNMGFGRREESEKELAEITWTASLEPRSGGGETLKVRAATPNPEPYFFRAEVRVLTPSLDAVTVRTREGHVSVIENQGAVDVETTHGDVRVLTPWPITSAVKVVTNQGSIDYRVRGESRGAFDCETHGGEVRQRCEYGRWNAMVKGNDHDRLVATLNDGKNPVFLRTSEKNIRVAVVADPTNVGREIVDP